MTLIKTRYFDYAATTPVRPEVVKEMIPYLEMEYGNPSSMYALGRHNKKAIEVARQKIATTINCKKNEVYFTSCGSESDNLAIKGIMYANRDKGNHIITTKIEHPAVLNTCKWMENHGFEVTYLDVDSDGIVNLESLQSSIKSSTVLISIMYANNEIGTIQPIEKIAKIARSHGIIIHTDAVQAFGNVKIDVNLLGIDAMSVSGHKIYAPKGVGALYVKNGVKFDCMQAGGHQEQGKRAGTENVAGIVALGKATELIYNELEANSNKLISLRDYYIYEVEKRFKYARLNGHRTKRLPGNANFSFKGLDANQLLMYLDEKGICASVGSACTSGTTEPSHVLLAIGLKEEYAAGTLRITFGKYTTKEDVDFLLENLKMGRSSLVNFTTLGHTYELF